MKKLINYTILVFLLGLCIVVGYLEDVDPKNYWGLAYIPLIIVMICWGIKMDRDSIG